MEHGFHAGALPVREVEATETRGSPEAAARKLVERLDDVTAFAQAALAATQQRYEDAANSRRQAAERFEVGDKVWLRMAHYRTGRPCKKLDALHHKYTVTKVISPHVVELNVPGAIYPRFHVDQVKRAGTEPPAGQTQDDTQPPPIEDEDAEWLVDSILCARWKKLGRGRRRECLVKWQGYYEPTWVPLENVEDTVALDEFERLYGPATENDGPLESYVTPQRGRRSQRRG